MLKYRTSMWQKFLLLILAISISSSLATAEENNQSKAKTKTEDGLTLEKLFPKKSLFGPSARMMAFSRDGKYVAYRYRNNKERRHGSDLWVIEMSKKTPRRITSPSVLAAFQRSAKKVIADREKKAQAHLKKSKEKKDAKKMVQEGWIDEKDADDTKAPRYSGISSYVWSRNGHQILFQSESDLYKLQVESGKIKRLTMSKGRKSSFRWLPDDSGYAYQGSDGLMMVKFGSDYQRQIVAMSSRQRSRFGQSSSVPREFLGEYRFSPDGKFVSVMSIRFGAVPNGRKVNIATYRDRFMKVREVPRQVSDDEVRPREVKITIYPVNTTDTDSLEMKPIYRHKFSGPRDTVSVPQWSPNSKKIAFATFTQTTERMEFWEATVADAMKAAKSKPKTAAKKSSKKKSATKTTTKKPTAKKTTVKPKVKPIAKKLHQFLHTGGSTTPGMIQPEYLADSRHLIFMAEQSGFRQLHILDPVYESMRQLTSGPFEVYPVQLSKDRKSYFVTATKEDTSRLDVYSVDTESGKMTRLSVANGYYSSPAISDDGSTVLSNFAAFGSPKELYLVDVQAKKQTKLTHSHPKKTLELVKPKPEFFTYKNREGQTIHGHLWKPDGWKIKGKYPLLIYVYGGPLGTRKNVVEGSFQSSSYFFGYYMAKKHGYVTCTIDPRGMSGYSASFEKASFGQVGKPQARDLADGVKFLIKNYGVDAEKVAIHGWSFGGFQTQMCMYLEPDVFKVGIAGAGPTEWQNYNKWYSTGTIGKTKVGEPELKKYSLLPLAKNLKGNLLLIHGMEDPNVLYQDTVRVYRELLKAGKGHLVELFLDPTGTHGLGGDIDRLNRYRKYETFLLLHMGSGKK